MSSVSDIGSFCGINRSLSEKERVGQNFSFVLVSHTQTQMPWWPGSLLKVGRVWSRVMGVSDGCEGGGENAHPHLSTCPP